jgi:hypothetical protein
MMFLFGSWQGARANVIYHELFSVAQGQTSTSLPVGGWVAYEGANGAVWSGPGFAPSSAVVEDGSVNSNPLSPDGVTTTYMYAYGHSGKASFVFTNEYSFSLDTWKSLQFWARTNHQTVTGKTGETIRAALKVNGSWYVSDGAWTMDAGSWSLSNPSATWSIAADSVNWRTLTFNPGTTMSVGSLVNLPATGTVSAFGYYVDALTVNRAIRMDNYKIQATSQAINIDIIWDNDANDGSWNNGLNWSTNVVPGTADTQYARIRTLTGPSFSGSRGTDLKSISIADSRS